MPPTFEPPDDLFGMEREFVDGSAAYVAAPGPDWGDQPACPIEWELLTAGEADAAWADLNAWVHWLRHRFALPATVVPPYWHRHPELIEELSALRTHRLACYDPEASPSSPITWMRDLADTILRLRDWVALCGTRVNQDRPSRQTAWPGEPASDDDGCAVNLADREADFRDFVAADVARRRQIEAAAEAHLRLVRDPDGTGA
ncbi:hypothetical protein [Xylanimonas ulmi]|uniref:Uncharacterized protein n=1 Tax=Xylanimonas ulmi TaxID=228973 RepID=A0A4Q7M226_9MICO|nr:hypothetical protein [Xylanibacterium ulmi]RZS60642.1 hypothetical protein EV386_0912 [Xylanibacterium ulmi]